MSYELTQRSPAAADREQEHLWLEEQHWGHRLWDQQSPWLVFLEFIGAADSAHRAGKLFDFEHSLYPSAYSAYTRICLRNILFRNEHLLFRTAQTVGDSAAAWTSWLKYMSENASGLDPGQRDFSYLRDRFDSFHDFAALVRALRSCIVEPDTNKRWSSRFLFPFGPAALYEDLDIKAKGVFRDYTNFGRSGELLYLMLSRAERRAELAALFPGRVLEGANKWNRLVARLQPDEQQTNGRRGVEAFLPYDQHPVFDLIAEDWIALLRLRLPGFDIIPYLVTSGAFGLLLYQLHTSAHVCGDAAIPSMICEALGPRRTLVRELAIESFDENAGKSVEAMECLIRQAQLDPQWRQPGPPIEVLARRRDVLTRMFRWKNVGSVSDPEEILRELRREAKERHQRHFGQVHRTLGRGVGLVSKRSTNRLRYAPTDAFLKCLIYANIARRTEFGELLQRLYRRYGLVFGDREAEQARIDREIDKKPFQANALRLEQRLSSLGLLKRLSDACAYVENPYGS
jgi:hypothetical protein